jgi:stage IV sporulation protein FA
MYFFYAYNSVGDNMGDIDEIKNVMKKKRNIFNSTNTNKTSSSHKLLYSFIVKTLILVLIGLITLIYIKKDDKNKQLVYKYVFEQNISFSNVKEIYNKYLGGILPFDNIFKVNSQVFSEKLKYKSSNKYKDGVSLSVDKNYLVPILQGGIITFVGDKDGYGKTVIIESDDIIIWYGNIDNITANLYDYVDKGAFLGETLNDKLYLVFKKEGKVVDYKKYI